MPPGRRNMSMMTKETLGACAASSRKTSFAVSSAHQISWHPWSVLRLPTGLFSGQGFYQKAGNCRLQSVAAYAQRLQQQYGRLDLDALTPAERQEYLQIQLRAVFVEPNVREDPPPVELPKELWEKLQAEGDIRQEDLPLGFDRTSLQMAQAAYQAQPLRRVLDVLVEDASRLAVILGDPGAGKSTLARYLTLSLLEADPDSRLGVLQGYLPLLVELRTYARVRAEAKAETFVEFLAYLAEAEGYPFNAGQLEEFLRSEGRALVIFDGLDELFDPADRELAAKRIAGFAARYPAIRVLVTSRIIGYRRAILTNSGFEHYTLQDLGDEQIGDFLATWYGLAFHGRDQDAASAVSACSRP